MTSIQRVGGKDEDLVHVLGYLNFSSGKSDPKALQALNRLYGWAIAGGPVTSSPFAGMPAWLTIQQWLQDRLVKLADENPIFRESNQASQVIQLVWLHLLPNYLDYHSDLLFHQEPEVIFNGLFLGRALEAALANGGPWDEVDRIVEGSISRLNDYVGFRPVAVLEGRNLEPYAHEWLRPIPLWIAEVGVAFGPHHDIISRAMSIIRTTDPDTLRSAHFDVAMLDELAMDPRAYDFDHPVNKRPNYHFGQWDPHLIDERGNYRRFVIQQVTIDALLARLREEKEIPRDELLTEAASVLAGTMLMASGISGSGPSTFASTVTLASLLSPIANYRDSFYDQLLKKMQGAHAERLQAENSIRRQPFGGARQHLNTYLARQRASQLEHVQLARLFARMGNAVTAKEESDHVQVASARILCRIDCLLTSGNQELLNGDLKQASAIPRHIFDLLHRGIECGALVDPWNILGFAGNFNRFHGPDAAIHDHRIDELVHLMEQIFGFQARLWREAAAHDHQEICLQVESEFHNMSTWWRKFAAHEISELQATDPQVSLESAELVARALRLWHQGGAAAGNIRFWAPHAEIFDSPKAYALVIEALLECNDFVASMALLIHWLSQANRVGLESGSISFSDLARMWLERLNHQATIGRSSLVTPQANWQQIERFFDLLEANGDEFWQPPKFQLAQENRGNRSRSTENDAIGERSEERESEDQQDSVFGAAYDGVVFEDSTNDGVEGSIFEEDSGTQDELTAESRRLCEHLTFLAALAQMWKFVALSPKLLQVADDPVLSKRQTDAMERWCTQSAQNRNGLLALVDHVADYRVSRGGSDHESMSRYDRKRLIKESLLERVISTAVETADARRVLVASVLSKSTALECNSSPFNDLVEEDQLAVRLYADLMSGKRSEVEDRFAKYLSVLRSQKLLYLPLARGGKPEQIFNVRLRRRVLSHLLNWLPRQGLFFQATQLLETARFMEHQNPVGPGAVTEFDELFQMSYKAIVRCLVRNAYAWDSVVSSRKPQSNARRKANPSSRDQTELHSVVSKQTSPSLGAPGLASNPIMELSDLMEASLAEPTSEQVIPLLEQLTEVLLSSWLAHSRTLRLSILETVENDANWTRLVAFIEKYGVSLFTQQFLKLGNVRAILHQGVAQWLQQAAQDGDQEEVQPILDAIDRNEITAHDAQRWLSIVLEAIIDHYSEYRDYNSTTTQSDRGEMIYMLLDFLRLRVRYDRVSWNLKPVFWAHEVLVRTGCHHAANRWRRALSQRISREADQYMLQLTKLQQQYAMRMPTVADRLGERFIKPMTIDRMRAYIRPAMAQLRNPAESHDSLAFELLVKETRLLTQEPTGVGLDVPAWLVALEEEVERVQASQRGTHSKSQHEDAVPMVFLSPKDIVGQLNAAAKSGKTLHLPNVAPDAS